MFEFITSDPIFVLLDAIVPESVQQAFWQGLGTLFVMALVWCFYEALQSRADRRTAMIADAIREAAKTR